MATERTLRRIDAAMWTLIFGGLFVAALGIATQRTDGALGWSLVVAGALAVAAGVALVWLRSRLHDDSAPHSANPRKPK